MSKGPGAGGGLAHELGKGLEGGCQGRQERHSQAWKTRLAPERERSRLSGGRARGRFGPAVKVRALVTGSECLQDADTGPGVSEPTPGLIPWPLGDFGQSP